MARPMVVLADPDAAYIAALELRFLEELGEAIDLSVITDKSYFDEFMMEPHDIEALLVDEEWYTGDLSIQHIEKLFVLVEDQDRDRTSIMTAEYTFKFTGINMIYGKVTSACPRLRLEASSSSECRVVLFFSPVGGSGCTTAALGVASALQDAFKRVLFVDAEYVQSFKCYMKNGKTAPTSMVRDMAKLSGDTYGNVSEYIESEGFDYLPPLRAGLTSYGVEFDFFYRFVESARDSGEYDYVIVDADSVFNDEKTELIGLADRVVSMVTQDAASQFKTMKLIDNLDATASDKFHFICSKYEEGRPNAFDEQPAGASIELDGFFSLREDVPDMNVGQLGALEDVKRIARAVG